MLCAQTQTKKLFESVALQRFQKVYSGSFDRQLMYIALRSKMNTEKAP
jgi:hypothetical protein